MQATLGTIRELSLSGFSEAALIWLCFNDLNLRIHHCLPMISSKLPRPQACFVLVSILLQHQVWTTPDSTNGKISPFFTTSLCSFIKSQSSVGLDLFPTLCSLFLLFCWELLACYQVPRWSWTRGKQSWALQVLSPKSIPLLDSPKWE